MFNFDERVEETGLYFENALAILEVSEEPVFESVGENIEDFFKDLIQSLKNFFQNLKENILKKSTEISMKHKLKQAKHDVETSDDDLVDLSILDGLIREQSIQKMQRSILKLAEKSSSKIYSAKDETNVEKLFLEFEDRLVQVVQDIQEKVPSMKVDVSPSDVSASFKWEMGGINSETERCLMKINGFYSDKIADSIDKNNSENPKLDRAKLDAMKKIQSHVASFSRKVATIVSSDKFKRISEAYS